MRTASVLLRHNTADKLRCRMLTPPTRVPAKADRTSCLHTASTPWSAGGPASLVEAAEDPCQLLKDPQDLQGLQDSLDDLPPRFWALGHRLLPSIFSGQVI